MRMPEFDFVEPKTVEEACAQLVARDAQLAVPSILVPEAPHLDTDPLGQLPGEVLHVHARSTVDVGRVLAGQEERLHVGKPSTVL